MNFLKVKLLRGELRRTTLMLIELGYRNILELQEYICCAFRKYYMKLLKKLY